jgi:hypothetical protein
LYFDGCSSHPAVRVRLHELLGELGIGADVVERRVETDAVAQRERFLGSPTLRIDGRDIEAGASDRIDYGLKCRLYRTEDGLSGAPPDDWVLDAVRRAGASRA